MKPLKNYMKKLTVEDYLINENLCSIEEAKADNTLDAAVLVCQAICLIKGIPSENDVYPEAVIEAAVETVYQLEATPILSSEKAIINRYEIKMNDLIERRDQELYKLYNKNRLS
jgi:hypothetical protein